MSSLPTAHLMAPLKIREIALRNRIAVSPMCQYSSDSRVHQWIDVPDGMELPPAGAARVDRIGVTAPRVDTVAELEGMVVNVELLEYPERGASPAGRVVEILGHPDDFGVDVEIIIRKHHLPHQFPPEVIEQAQAMPAQVAEADIA